MIVWISPHGTEWEADTYEEALEKERDSLVEQLNALRLAAARQLTPLDVAITHIDILRRKNKEYEAGQVENVAAIVESNVKEARGALFAAIDGA